MGGRAHVYSSVHVNTSESLPKDVSICSAFLANIDEHKSAGVKLFDRSYTLAPCTIPHNISPLLSGNTDWTKTGRKPDFSQNNRPFFCWLFKFYSSEYHLLATEDFSLSSTWMTFIEPIGIWNENSFTSEQILEHLNVTKDASDYLWYITRVNVSEVEISYWMEMGILPSLTIHSIRDVAQIFLNGLLIGGAHGNWVKLEQTLKLVQGCNELALLSETVGLKNYGAFIEKDGAGFKGPIKLIGFKDGDMDLSTYPWTYQRTCIPLQKVKFKLQEVFRIDHFLFDCSSNKASNQNFICFINHYFGTIGRVKGNLLEYLISGTGKKVSWIALEPDKIQATFIWYKAYFDAPDGKDPISIYLGGMGKGQAWVNGHGIGRYWSLVAPKDGCSETCNYQGRFYNEKKCRTNCGKPTQTWYHIPREWLQASNNLFVIFEETGGNPLTIKLKKIATKTIRFEVSKCTLRRCLPGRNRLYETSCR
ncbi:hypothetical protein HPP92_007944 [Vanilla planifolia]|uniref:Beta-galactosidase galactose-binding domain-containing protein n=1 Tax=Vanilla planifolia TaxID=51239 RepID=A0A835VCB1_VANPL|nr:hypothetical protein HPP92_007944 [Vanilla planifolia]